MKSLYFLAASMVVSLFAAGDAVAGKKTTGEAFLIRPTPAPDPDIKGRIKFETENGKDRDKFECKIELADPAGSYALFIENAVDSGTVTNVGALELDDSDTGEFDIKFDEKDGPLPLGVATVTDLYDRIIEVRNTVNNEAVLFTVLGDPADAPNGKKGWNKEKAALSLPLMPIDTNAKGRVELWFKGKDNRQRFRVKAEKLTAAETYTVQVEDSVGAGTFSDYLPMVIDGSPTEFKLHVDTQKGQPLPNGATYVTELAGLKVRIVDGADAVILEGTVPAFN